MLFFTYFSFPLYSAGYEECDFQATRQLFLHNWLKMILSSVKKEVTIENNLEEKMENYNPKCRSAIMKFISN